MPSPILIRSTFWEGDDPGWTLAQLLDKSANAIMPGDVSAIALNVYDAEDRALIYGPVSITPSSSVVFSTWMYAGTLWTEDDIGCNFASYLADADVFATTESEGGKVYRAEYDLTHTTSGNLSVVHELHCRSKYTQ